MLDPKKIFKFIVEMKRGISFIYDIGNWQGVFPNKFARYKVLVDYMESRGYELVKGKEAISIGCHEKMFHRL